MGDGTSIEWTNETWNPTVGCEAVSPGCDRCYAARQAGRLKNIPVYAGLATREPGQPAVFTGEVRSLPDRLDKPLHWRRPRRVFVDSMSDLFHPNVPTPFIAQVVGVMARASQHTFQVLTKRPRRMQLLLTLHTFWSEVAHAAYGLDPTTPVGVALSPSSPLPNVAWGTSIESDDYTWRGDALRATPAAVRFISAEPLLGPLPSLDLTGIDWLIVGGESGDDKGVRPMHPDWVRDLRDLCCAPRPAGEPTTAFFFKQWGEWCPARNGDDPGERHWFTEGMFGMPSAIMRRAGKKAAGRELDGRTWDEYPVARHG